MAKRRRKPKKSSSSKKKFKTNFKAAVSRDTERQEQNKKSYGYLKLPGGVPIFNPEPKSKVYMDIMPYVVSDSNHPDRYEEEGIAVEGELWYKRPFSIHRNIGVDNEAAVCLRSVGKKCPICEYRQRRMQEGAAYDEDDVKQAKPSKRNLYVVIPKSKGFEAIPHIWDMSDYLFQDLLNEELREDEDYAIFPDLEDGKTLKVRFDEGSAFGNTFPQASRIDFYDRKKGKGYDVDILDDIPDLDDVLEVLTYTELEAKFMELSPDDVIEEDEEWDEEEEFEEEPFEEEWEEKEDPEPEEEWEEEEFEEFEEPEEEEEWEDEEFEDEDWEEEEDWFDEEEEEEQEPAPEPKKRTRKRTKKRTRKRKK